MSGLSSRTVAGRLMDLGGKADGLEGETAAGCESENAAASECMTERAASHSKFARDHLLRPGATCFSVRIFHQSSAEKHQTHILPTKSNRLALPHR